MNIGNNRKTAFSSYMCLLVLMNFGNTERFQYVPSSFENKVSPIEWTILLIYVFKALKSCGPMNTGLSSPLSS